MDFRGVFLTYLEAPKSILAKNEKMLNFIKFIDFSPFPLFGVPCAAVNRVLAHQVWTRKSRESGLEN